jgi:excinuclease ABC subunit A
MQFLADVELICDDCKGTRFKSAILDIRYKGLNVHEVLQLTVTEAIKFFHDTPRLAAKLKLLEEAGLGYLRLGQSATTLSGGEAQRVKLAAHLAQATNEGTLFICDEPTTGLHFDDVRKLLEVLHRLADLGNSVIIIEHSMDVIRNADWVIDLGPEGGEDGGRIVAQGRPAQIAATPGSYTGHFLTRYYTTEDGKLVVAEMEEPVEEAAFEESGLKPNGSGSAKAKPAKTKKTPAARGGKRGAK